ncbi:MAG TPA: MotA/TolQ/ExbB proton channel family protein [Methylomirabilota bacterium]|nr:MotA/TolQ/ExbB proton channel family protein [Methylomirabilota bacterium]
MNHTLFFLADSAQQRLLFVWENATIEAKIIIVLLIFFSIFAWSVMAAKALQMRRAKQLNELFEAEFRAAKTSFSVYDRNINVEGCPLYSVYKAACTELDARLSTASGKRTKTEISVKNMEHVKRTMERVVAQESLRLESGLILLAIAVSGAPFLGLLGTVWGVMDTFSGVAIAKKADLTAMAPGVSAALITTVAGLLVAIPSMFGYNWLVHNLRVQTVSLDNFAQELASKMETEYLKDDDRA